MRILILGGGGREHALLWKLHRDHPEHEYLIAPGNGGTQDLARSVAVDPADPAAVLSLAREQAVEFTVVGPEAPLAAGVVDAFRAAGLPIFGPVREAARLETSKAFAKELMARHGVPTARFGVFRDLDRAARFARELGIPCVVKASGLAAGKGALLCASEAEAQEALDACLVRRDFGAAGDEVVVEEFLEGEECSMIAVTDGEDLIAFPPSQDHKRAEDGDRGGNTGGMGAYAPVSAIGATLQSRVLEEIFAPVLAAVREAGSPFTGCLYAGLMLTADGPQVLEWNARFGDPETQALVPLLESDLLELLMATDPAYSLRRLASLRPSWRSGACLTVVAASAGYPGPYETGAPIGIPERLAVADAFDREGTVLFHAGTRREDGRLLTAGGRVLNATALGKDAREAKDRAYAVLDALAAPSLRWRTDIGWRELARRD